MKEKMYQTSQLQTKITFDVLKELVPHCQCTTKLEVFTCVVKVLSNIVGSIVLTGSTQEMNKDIEHTLSELQQIVLKWINQINLERNDLAKGLKVNVFCFLASLV